MGRAENATGTANSRASSRIGSNSSGRPADVTESAPDATRGPQQEGDATNAGPLPPASFFGDNELSGSNEDDDDTSSGSDDETDPTEYMLQYVARQTELCSKVDDVGILVNNVDINDVCPKVVKMFATEPRSMSVLLPALRKLIPAVDKLCKEIIQSLADGLCGIELRQPLFDFLLNFTSAFRGHPWITCMSLLMLLAESRNSNSKTESRQFNQSYNCVKYVRHYCSLRSNQVTAFYKEAAMGTLMGLMKSVPGSVGLLRL
jgi:hypothetical protein